MSSAECNHCSPPSRSLVCGLLTVCDIVRHLPQGHMSVAARPHFFRQDARWPWLVWKRVRSAQWTSILLFTGRWCWINVCLEKPAWWKAVLQREEHIVTYWPFSTQVCLFNQIIHGSFAPEWWRFNIRQKQVTMIVVKSAGFWWWCTWWSWVAHLSRLYVMRVPVLG